MMPLRSSNRLFRGRIISVRRDEVVTPSGDIMTRDVVEHPGAVAIVPLLDDQTVLLVRQYRHPVGMELLEIPAGTLEPGEEPDDCAARELEEETGMRAGRLEPAFSIFLAPGYSSEVIHIYFAYDLTQGKMNLDEDEEITAEPTSLTQVEDLIRDGRLQDSKTVAALQQLLLARATSGQP